MSTTTPTAPADLQNYFYILAFALVTLFIVFFTPLFKKSKEDEDVEPRESTPVKSGKSSAKNTPIYASSPKTPRGEKYELRDRSITLTNSVTKSTRKDKGSCGCATGCQGSRCACNINGRKCSDACKCKNCTNK